MFSTRSPSLEAPVAANDFRSRAGSTFVAIFGIDLRTLALYRVCLALIIIMDLVARARDLTAHYSDEGVLPRAALLGDIGQWAPSLHLISGSPKIQALLFMLAGVVALALLVGYRTRAATILSWLLLLSLQARNPAIMQGGDMLLYLLLFWGIFLPLDARFSVDAALNEDVQTRPERLLLDGDDGAARPGHVRLHVRGPAEDQPDLDTGRHRGLLRAASRLPRDPDRDLVAAISLASRVPDLFCLVARVGRAAADVLANRTCARAAVRHGAVA